MYEFEVPTYMRNENKRMRMKDTSFTTQQRELARKIGHGNILSALESSMPVCGNYAAMLRFNVITGRDGISYMVHFSKENIQDERICVQFTQCQSE